MEFINFGKVVNVSASVPTAIDDATYHIIIDFVPDDPDIFDDFHDNMDEILKHPDYYVLCNIEDIFKVNGEIQNLREQRIKDISDLKKDRDYWKDHFDSAVTGFTKTLEANGIRFKLEAIDGKWEAVIDIPELNELKDENERLKTKVDDLFNERGVLQAKLVKRGAELECVKSENSELKKDLKDANKQLDSMDAEIDTLRNKNRDLEKELAESKTFAEAEGPACSDFKARKEN